MACWLRQGAISEVLTRFSVVVASVGGSESGRDTHGFATKIYSSCGNQDFVGNHPSSFFINDGAEDFPDLIHSVKYKVHKGFPTGGTEHTTAYDFFDQHPEEPFQLLNVLSDLGMFFSFLLFFFAQEGWRPSNLLLFRDPKGCTAHEREWRSYIQIHQRPGSLDFIQVFWLPTMGYRSLVYDEVTKIAGKNNNFQRVDLYNSIEAGVYPEWEFAVQLFPDDRTYMYQGYNLLIPTQIVPFEVNKPIKLGKLTLNRNPSNFFAEPESVSFAPSNVVDGVSFVPDPLLQWRLMVSYLQ